MTNIIDRVRADFDRLSPTDQAEIRAAAQNYAGAFQRLLPTERQAVRSYAQRLVSHALRRDFGTVAEYVPDFEADPDLDELPPLAQPPRKFSRSQLESGFANYPEPKEPKKRGPKATGVSRRWTSNVAKKAKAKSA